MAAAILEQHLDELRTKVQELKHFGSRLSEAMTQAAYDLRGGGFAPSAALIGDMRSFRDAFKDIRSQLKTPHETLPVGESNATSGNLINGTSGVNGTSGTVPGSLADLEQKIAAQTDLNLALKIVDAVLSLRHSDIDDFPPLTGCHADCRKLRTELSGSLLPTAMNRAQVVLTGGHPLAALWKLVFGSDELADGDWADMQEKVTSAYGRDMATAIARRKLLPVEMKCEIPTRRASEGIQQ